MIAPRKRRALVLSDEEPFGRLFILFMAMLGWDCEVANNAEEARRLLRMTPFDVVITDYHLADSNALHFLCCLRRDGIEIPAIVMSGDSKALLLVPKELLNVRAVMLKPFRGSELKDALRLALLP